MPPPRGAVKYPDCSILGIHYYLIKFIYILITWDQVMFVQLAAHIFVLVALKGGGGFRPFTGKNDFELGVGGDGQDTSRHFEGSFWSIRAILPM